MSVTVLVSLLVLSPLSQAETRQIAPPAGSSIVHFSQLDENIYVGSKPHTDQDFEFLHSQHIKYILNVRFLPFFTGSEKSMAKRHGISFISKPMNASFVAPQEKHVNEILLTLREKQYQPIYVHCVLGRDRTSLISGLYRIYFLGVSKSDAYAEMKESGFRTPWFLHGLKVYFDKHSTRPASMDAAVEHSGN